MSSVARSTDLGSGGHDNFSIMNHSGSLNHCVGLNAVVNMPNMATELNKEDRSSPEYLAQLLKDKKQIQAFPNVFVHLERLLDEEIHKVRVSLFHLNTNKDPVSLPDPNGVVTQMSEKLYVPSKEHPEFNFVGRILGPRGMTAKQLEQDTGCKIMVRGKGSMRDKKKEEQNRGKPNWEHLNEDLHVLITCEDTPNRAELKIRRAQDEVQKLLVPAPEGEDELKKMQLMELAILNGTYRDNKPVLTPQQMNGTYTTMAWSNALAQHPCMYTHSSQKLLQAGLMSPALRSPTSPGMTMAGMGGMGGAPIILAPRLPQMQTSTGSLLANGAPPPLVSAQGDPHGLIYGHYDPYAAAAAAAGLASPTLMEYPSAIDQSTAGAVPKVRRTVGTVREHPYTRVTLS